MRRLREIVDAIMTIAAEAGESRNLVASTIRLSNESNPAQTSPPAHVIAAADRALREVLAEHSRSDLGARQRTAGEVARDRTVALLGQEYTARIQVLRREGRDVLAQAERVADDQLAAFDDAQTTDAKMLRASLRVRHMLENGVAPVNIVQEAVARRDITQLRALREELPAFAHLTAAGHSGDATLHVQRSLDQITPIIDRGLFDLVTPAERQYLRGRLLVERYATVLDAANRLATTAATNGTPSGTLRIGVAHAIAELDRLEADIT